MKYIISILLITTTWAAQHINGIEIDKSEVIDSVILQSAKAQDIRFYRGFYQKEFQAPLDQVFEGISRFDQKCNNEYKFKRQHLAKDHQCLFHNKNIIENVLIRNEKTKSLIKNEISDAYIIERHIYSNGSRYFYYDLVKVTKTANKIIMKMNMLTDEEALQYIKEPRKRDSAFLTVQGTYTFSTLNEKSTQFEYEYLTSTDHWLINKEISVSKVFSNMSESFLNLFNSVAKHLEQKS